MPDGPSGMDSISAPLRLIAAVNGTVVSDARNFSGEWCHVTVFDCDSGVLEMLSGADGGGLSSSGGPVGWTEFAIYRYKATVDTESLRLQCRFDERFEAPQCGPDSGEHLSAVVFDSKGKRQHIGTEDEEALAWRAEQRDWLPSRWAKPLQRWSVEPEALPVRIAMEHDGLTIETDRVLAGEACQFQFVTSWCTTTHNSDNVASWLAVDRRPEELLDIASKPRRFGPTVSEVVELGRQSAAEDGTLSDDWIDLLPGWGWGAVVGGSMGEVVSWESADGWDGGGATGAWVEGLKVVVVGTVDSFHGREWFFRIEFPPGSPEATLYLAEKTGTGEHEATRLADARHVDEWPLRVAFTP